MASPYPWQYSLRWLYYYFRPSTKNHAKLPLRPRQHDFGGEATLRLIFFGDLMCMRGDRVPEIHPAIVELVRGADLVVANCETPVVFDARREDALYLTHFGTSAGFIADYLDALGATRARTVLSVANNHMGDQGTEGFATTLDKLAGLGLGVVGARARPMAVREVGGMRLGLVGWTRWLNFEVFGEGQGVLRDPDARALDWRALAAEVDLLIATPHWEYEFQHFPREETCAHAKALAEAGVGLIVGHHPHVIQPVEWLEPGLCLYSLGNLNGPAYSHVAWPVQLACAFEVRVGPSGVVGYTLHPLAQLIAEDRSATVVPLDAAPEPLRGRLAARLGLIFEG